MVLIRYIVEGPYHHRVRHASTSSSILTPNAFYLPTHKDGDRLRVRDLYRAFQDLFDCERDQIILRFARSTSSLPTSFDNEEDENALLWVHLNEDNNSNDVIPRYPNDQDSPLVKVTLSLSSATRKEERIVGRGTGFVDVSRETPNANETRKGRKINDTSNVWSSGGGQQRRAERGEDLSSATSRASVIMKQKGEEISNAASSVLGGLWSHGSSLLRKAKEGVAKATSAIMKHVAGETLQIGEYNVRIERKIADGGFSQVFLCTSCDSDQPVVTKYALKVMFADENDEMSENIRKELNAHDALTQLKCTHIVPLLAKTVRRSATKASRCEYQMLFPYYERNTLFHVLLRAETNAAEEILRRQRQSGRDDGMMESTKDTTAGWPFTESSALRIFALTCKGLASMHKAGVAHRDLKTANVMLSNETPVYPLLTDFGSCVETDTVRVTSRRQARTLQDEAAQFASEAYRAPELFDVTHPSTIDPIACDLFSLGCVLFALAFGRSPFETSANGDRIVGNVKLAVLSGNVPFPEDNRNVCGVQFSDGYCSLVRDLLDLNPKKRPSLRNALKRAGILRKEWRSRRQ